MTSQDKNDSLKYKITPKGSLGLLAYGDIGLRAWRKVKLSLTNNHINEEE